MYDHNSWRYRDCLNLLKERIMKTLTLLLIFGAVLAAEPKKVSDKALNWEILARASQASAIQAQINALQAELQKVQSAVQAAVNRACEAEKIAAEKCIPRVDGDVVSVEAKPEPSAREKGIGKEK